MKNNNNICSIYHKRFKQLVGFIGCHRKAQLIDYILLGWQSSIYKLKGSDQKWFMKHYKEISSDTSIPESTLQKYIKELADEGFIVRRQALYSRKNGEGLFEVKKGNYIHPTNKLLELLAPPSEGIAHQQYEAQQPHTETPVLAPDKNEGIDPVASRESFISDLDYQFNNTISRTNTFIDVDKNRRQSQFDAIKQFFTQDIGAQIPDSIKSLLMATFCSLIFKHKKEFSNPKQTAAEYLWAFVNFEYHMPWAKDIKFRNNIFAKMIRNNSWRTPKGFLKHSCLATQFKKPSEVEQDWKTKKALEIKGAHASIAKIQAGAKPADNKLVQIEKQIHEKVELLDSLQNLILQQDTEEMIIKYRAQIYTARKELENLWTQQRLTEEALGLCA